MTIQTSWLRHGYFDLSGEDQYHTTTQAIRKHLEEQLALPAGSLRIASYPVGPAWRHTFWWREGNVEHAEAQFFAQVAQERPSLSLGISVEKGLEDEGAAPAQARDTFLMDRASWDWPRFVERTRQILGEILPGCVASAPPYDTITVRIIPLQMEAGTATPKEVHAFSFADGSWYKRHRGTALVETVVELVRDLDRRRDYWVDLYVAYDLGPAEAGGMTAAEAASALLRLQPLRRALRP